MRRTIKDHKWPAHISRFTGRRAFRGLPAIALGFILNLLDLVSTGMLIFPTGPQSGFIDVLPSGLAIYLTSIITGQLALTLGGSSFRGAFSSMLVGVLPLMKEIALDI